MLSWSSTDGSPHVSSESRRGGRGVSWCVRSGDSGAKKAKKTVVVFCVYLDENVSRAAGARPPARPKRHPDPQTRRKTLQESPGYPRVCPLDAPDRPRV